MRSLKLTILLLAFSVNASALTVNKVVDMSTGTDGVVTFIEGYVAGVRDAYLVYALDLIDEETLVLYQSVFDEAWRTCNMRSAWHVDTILASMKIHTQLVDDINVLSVPAWYDYIYMRAACPEVLTVLQEAFLASQGD